MEAVQGYYSLIQYCPDESRLEALNIGVALFCPQLRTVRVRVSGGAYGRIRKTFKQTSRTMLEAAVDAVQQRLERVGGEFATREDFTHFAATRANGIGLTIPRYVKVNEIEATTGALFERLVGEQARIRRAPKVIRKFRNVLQSQGVLQLVSRKVEVRIPQLGKTIRTNYGYQNGRFNIIRPEQFSLSDEEQVLEKASRLAVEGRFLYDDPDPELGELQFVVVAEFSPEQHKAPARVQAIFEKNQVRIYRLSDLNPLISDIRLNAETHGVQLLG